MSRPVSISAAQFVCNLVCRCGQINTSRDHIDAGAPHTWWSLPRSARPRCSWSPEPRSTTFCASRLSRSLTNEDTQPGLREHRSIRSDSCHLRLGPSRVHRAPLQQRRPGRRSRRQPSLPLSSHASASLHDFEPWLAIVHRHIDLIEKCWSLCAGSG